MEDDGIYDLVEVVIELFLEVEVCYVVIGIWDFVLCQLSLFVIEGIEGIYVGLFEVLQQMYDVIVLLLIESLINDVVLFVQYNLFFVGIILEFDDCGFVVVICEGVLMFEWIMVFVGKFVVVFVFFLICIVVLMLVFEEVI